MMNPPALAIVGAGRLGTALMRALPGIFTGLFGLGFDEHEFEATAGLLV